MASSRNSVSATIRIRTSISYSKPKVPPPVCSDAMDDLLKLVHLIQRGIDFRHTPHGSRFPSF